MSQRTKQLLTALAAGVACVLAIATAAVAATVIGDSGPNVLTGTDERDRILGRGGDDAITALAGADLVRAGRGDDTVDAGDGRDRVRAGFGSDIVDGGDGRDLLAGGRGDDVQTGGPGADLIFAGRGVDRTDGGDGPDLLWALARKDVDAIGDQSGDDLTGGNGRDRFRVRDGEADRVHCGDGIDRVKADQFDVVDGDCEHVHRREITSLRQVEDEAENRMEG